MKKLLISILLTTSLFANEILIELGIRTAGAITGLIMGATIEKIEDNLEEREPSTVDQKKNNQYTNENKAIQDTKTNEILDSYIHLQDD